MKEGWEEVERRRKRWKLGFERSTERWGGGGGVGGAGDLEESLPNILGVGIEFPRSPIQGYGLIRYMHTHT